MRLATLAGIRPATIVAAAAFAAACNNKLDFDIGELDFCTGVNQTVASIKFDPTQVNLRVGFNARVLALPMNAQGQLTFCAPAVTWSSSNVTIATVSDGVVTAVGGGSAFIRASSGGKTDSIPATITASTIASVTMEQLPPPLLIGQTAALKLVARDAAGTIIVPLSVTWQTDDAAVVSVSSTGMAIARNDGSATVTAVAEGVSATARIVVTRDLPVRRFLQIAAGTRHACALVGGGGIADGTAFCWGDGVQGQLGTGASNEAVVPTAVSGGHTFSSIVAGDHTSCGLTASGDAYCWGSNGFGQLGDGTLTSRNLPTRVATTKAFTTLAAGGDVTCGLTSDGSAYCWGRLGDRVITQTPTLLPGGIQFSSLAGGGGGFICGRTSAGRVYCWGSIFTFAPATPTAVPGELRFSSISAGAAHACGIAISDGVGYCWGRMDAFPLGNAISQGVHQTPIAIPGDLRFADLSPGAGFTCGRSTTGAYCLGNTGLSNASTSSTPRRIPKDDILGFTALSAGGSLTCATDRTHGGWCWGQNEAGQVGIGAAGPMVTEPLQLRIP